MPSFVDKSGQTQQVAASELSGLIKNWTILPDTIITLDDGRSVPANNIVKLRKVFDEVGPPPAPPKPEGRKPKNKDNVLQRDEYYEYTTVAIPWRIVIDIPFKDRRRADAIQAKSCESYAEFINEKLAAGWELCSPVIEPNTVIIDSTIQQEDSLPDGCSGIFAALFGAGKSQKANVAEGEKQQNKYYLCWFRRRRKRR